MNNLSSTSIETAIDVFMNHHGAYFGELESLQVAEALRELLALREAQSKPVGFRWRHPASRDYAQAWSYVTHRTTPDAFESDQVVQYLYAAPQLPTLLDIRNELCDNKDHSTGKLCMRPSGHYGACTLSRGAIAAAPKPGSGNG